MNPAQDQIYDVLGLGCAVVDDLLYVPTFPAPDQKTRVTKRQRRCGGLTGTALVAAARLGARCAYAGGLAADELAACVVANFTAEGVDLSHAPRLATARTGHSVIVVGEDTGSRNIFSDSAGILGAHESLPPAAVLRQARVLFIDHFGIPGNLRAVEIARAAGVAVVADFEDQSSALFAELLPRVDHLILSEEFARRVTGQSTAAAAAEALWRPDRSAVVVTCGARGCWSVSAATAGTAHPHPAFAVQATDTTGCGDVFHGAYAAELARGAPLATRLRVAMAAAALKARDGEIPRRPALEQFLQTQPPRPPGPADS